MKAAPTAKAAFNIKGNTLNSAFKIPINRSFSYCTLDTDRLNTIRTQLRKLHVIFIDEISMEGIGMFNFLNLRLQQITDTNKPFGSLSIMAVGDLHQLQPVFYLTEIMSQKDAKYFAQLLRACPREHQAVVLHAISLISMKLCQFKGSTSKLKKTNRFLFWFFPGGDRPPPGFSWFSPRKSLQIGKMYEALTAMVFN